MFHDNQVLMRELSKLWIKVKAQNNIVKEFLR